MTIQQVLEQIRSLLNILVGRNSSGKVASDKFVQEWGRSRGAKFVLVKSWDSSTGTYYEHVEEIFY